MDETTTTEHDAWLALDARTREIRAGYDDPFGFDWHEYQRAKHADPEYVRLDAAWREAKQDAREATAS